MWRVLRNRWGLPIGPFCAEEFAGECCHVGEAGEITVSVPNMGGTGGRNQHFVLQCAQQIAGENIAVLRAGTDGIDSNSSAAGAVTDGTSVVRTREAGIDVHGALRAFDSYHVFEKLGDLIVTGPTGNNVRDLRILLAY